MAYEFTIDFFGMCAFVRRSAKSEVEVLLPVTDMDKKTHLECQGLTIPPHEARLAVSLANLPTGPPDFFDRQISLPDGPWFSGSIGGYRLTIEKAKNDALILRTGRPKDGPPCPNYDDQDISWLADMERVCGVGQADPDSLQHDKNVASRVSLTEGALHCASLSTLGDQVVIFEFTAVGGRQYQQALADRIRYTLTVKAPPTLRLVGLETSKQVEPPPPPVSLSLRGQPGLPIRVAVSHIPLNPDFNDPHHFHGYYNVAAGNPPHNLPNPSAMCPQLPADFGLRNSPKICPQPGFVE